MSMQIVKPVTLADDSRIGDFIHGYFQIRIKCACGHEREPRGEFIRRIIGIETTIRELRPRLRCHKCGRHGARVEVYRLPR